MNKPAGCSSRHAVDRVERIVRPAKAGHAGTLDPLASGVLVVCVGQATRLIPYVQQMAKHYRGTFLLGHQSETDDVEGEVVPLADPPIPTREALEAALPRFLGDIQQTPPAHSAIKIGGQRAYKLARAGKPVELAARPVTIHRLAIHRFEYPTLELDIECGSGTYVRSLGRDLAAALGTAAVMTALVRTAIGQFTLSSALKLVDVTPDSVHANLLHALAAVPNLERVSLEQSDQQELRHGRPIAKRDSSNLVGPADATTEYAAIDERGELVALLRERQPGQLWPALNFLR